MTPLYSDLSEEEANEIMAVLLAENIPCEKKPGKEDKWMLHAKASDFPRAMEKLKALELPRAKFDRMGDMFQKSGLVSSPTEERIRYMYGLSQELSETLMKIDGVLTARVHIVIPNNDPLSENVKPSSASVFIKYRPGYDLESTSPDLKNLIARSIEGLVYDNVTIILMQGQDPPSRPVKEATVATVKTEPWMLPAAAGTLGLALGAGGMAIARRGRKDASSQTNA